jgi:hypothetical protein
MISFGAHSRPGRTSRFLFPSLHQLAFSYSATLGLSSRTQETRLAGHIAWMFLCMFIALEVFSAIVVGFDWKYPDLGSRMASFFSSLRASIAAVFACDGSCRWAVACVGSIYLESGPGSGLWVGAPRPARTLPRGRETRASPSRCQEHLREGSRSIRKCSWRGGEIVGSEGVNTHRRLAASGHQAVEV